MLTSCRLAMLTALATFALVITGACLTSQQQTTGGWLAAHVGIAVATAGLLLVLTFAARKDRLALRLCLVALATVVFDAALGERGSAPGASPWMGVIHACVAPILLTLTSAAALCTSTGWKAGPEPVLDHGWPSLRSLAVITPVLILVQVLLGAGFRHKTMGLTWHIVGAMIVALTILIFGMFVNQQFPSHRALRPWAVVMLVAAMVQVLLGVAALTTEMLAPENTVTAGILLSTVAHVSVGALTLAASLILAIQIRRHVHKAAEEPEEESSTAAT